MIMGKLAQATVKYTIVARFEADGYVEKPDVIGAIFGQTEGLLGPEMDLRELQRTGRIGRIEVKIENKNRKSTGVILIPSSLDTTETALIAACCETIERIGPCNAKIRVERIEDVRSEKRKYVIERAKELLKMMYDYGEEMEEIAEQLKEAIRSSEITEYKGLPSGPNIENYDSIIIVEGRADVVNLLRHGIKNVIAIEGTSVPEPIIELTKKKVTTAFLDGDRGGDLILKELISVGDIDFVARAPYGKEVEELSKKEIFKALRDKVPLDQYLEENGKRLNIKPTKEKEERKEEKERNIDEERMNVFKEKFDELMGTRGVVFLDEELKEIGRVPIKEIFNAIKEVKADVVILDGDIDQKLINTATQTGIRFIVAKGVRGKIKPPEFMKVITQKDLE